MAGCALRLIDSTAIPQKSESSSLSFRDVEDHLAERGTIVSYEAIRRWCCNFGPDYARPLKRKQGCLGDTCYLDELFIRINSQQQYLWHAVDQDDDVIDILLQSRSDQRAAERFLRRLLRGQGKQPFRTSTVKLKSYAAAGRTILPGVTYDTQQYANNRAEIDSLPTLEIAVLRGLATRNGGLTISNSSYPISPNSFRIA